MVTVVATVTEPPITTPVADPTVAIAVLLLLQVPPVEPSLNVVVKPEHTCKVPVIATGNGLTFTVTVSIQPVPKV